MDMKYKLFRVPSPLVCGLYPPISLTPYPLRDAQLGSVLGYAITGLAEVISET